MLGLLKRIKLRISKHHKAENPLPVLTLQEFDEGDEAELLEEVKEDAERDVLALQAAMRGSN